jgi:hypothetical protein
MSDEVLSVHNEPHRLEAFWLCENCSASLFVRVNRGMMEVVARDTQSPGRG